MRADRLLKLLVVHSYLMPSLNVGDRINVTHVGQITLSYP